MPAVANMSVVVGRSVAFDPAHRARESAPVPAGLDTRSAARCVATSAEEHAVSATKLAPLQPNTYDSRPHATLRNAPSAVYGDAPSDAEICAYSAPEMPTATPACIASAIADVVVTVETVSSASSRSLRCCGSTCDASASATRNAPASKYARSGTTPPKRAEGASGASTRHLSPEISATASNEGVVFRSDPPGSVAATPTSRTTAPSETDTPGTRTSGTATARASRADEAAAIGDSIDSSPARLARCETSAATVG